jgi:ferric-dicitrate binding protein FerR (iron transport regulator)
MARRQETDKKLVQFIDGKKKFVKDLEKVDVETNWERFQKSIERATDRPGIIYLVQKNRLALSRIAAAVLLLIAVTSIVYFAGNTAGSQIIQVSSVHDNTELTLSEGSSIVLRKGSVLSYPEKLRRNKREVFLSGEAYFEVAEKTANPFYIYIGDFTVKVLGTSFNVKEEGQGKITVSVIKGKVLFYRSGEIENALQLAAGQEGSFDVSISSLERHDFRSENFLYWKTGKLSYKYESLAVVFEELGSSFNTQFLIEDPDILENRLTTSFDGQQRQDVLSELAMLFDLKFSTHGDTVYVSKKHP